MNKKLMAVAVAGALAAPGLALAQASVVISGFVKVAVGQQSNSGAATVAGADSRNGLNKSESRLNDDGPTRIAFDMRDQIDSDLAGIAKLELRPTIDGSSSVAGLGFGSSAGNMFVGLESKNMGTLRLGSLDQHYTVGVDTGAAYAPTEVANGLLNYSYIAQPVQGVTRQTTAQTSHTGASRTRNLVRWDSPNWSGFRVGVGYSFNTATNESDMLSSGRKGSSMNINPTYTAATWRVMYSYLDDKRDGTGIVSANNYKGQRLAGDVKLGDFTLGAAWDSMKGETNTFATGATTQIGDRTAWALSGKYQTGKHIVTGMYSKANKDKVLVGETGAKNYSISYAYLFSARTSVGLGYSVLKNDTLGAYTLAGTSATTAVGNGYSSIGGEAYAGEKQSYYGVSVRQSF
jgi:predicted porin